MGRWKRYGRGRESRADRDMATTLGVTEEVFDPPWDVVSTRTPFGCWGRNEEFLRGEGLRTAEGGVRVEDGEDHLWEDDN